MGDRGKRSSASLSVVSPNGSELPRPPAHYKTDQANLWSRLVAEKPADWWDSATLPMLDEFVTVTFEIQRIAALVTAMHPIKSDDEMLAYERMQKIYDRLSAQRKRTASMLRLSNQSRYNAQSSATASKRGGGSRPWEI